MAYGNYLASVSEEQIRNLRHDPKLAVNPSAIVLVSHLIAYWVKAQPLGKLLGEALDGGQPLNSTLWHPLRAPTYHSIAATTALFQQISDAWNAATGEPFPEMDWYRVEIERVLSIFGHASKNGEGVISVLEPPLDQERASRVHLPLVVPGGDNLASIHG